jgi:hypothetical protein
VRTIHEKARARGRWKIKRYTHEAYRNGEEPLGTIDAGNALVTAGLQHALDRIRGSTTSSALSSSSVLRIYNSSISLQKTLTGTSTGPTHLSISGASGRVTLEWTDSSTDSYSAHTLRVYYAGNTIQLSNTAPAFGTKPTGETWVYEWTFSITSSAPMVGAGLDRMMRIITGNSSLTYNSSRTQVQVRNDTGIGCTAGTLLWSATPGSAPTRSGSTVTWTFVTGIGDGTGSWACYAIRNTGTTAVDLRRGEWAGVGPADQTAHNIRTFNYSFTLT